MNRSTAPPPVTARDVDFLFEIGTLRRVARAWIQFGEDRQLANVAEHTLRVIWLSMLIAKAEGADISKTLELALVHDLPETRTGDVNYLTRMYVDRREDQAIADCVAGTSIANDVSALWAEYHAQETLEARVVKDADNLDCDLELAESAARGADFNEAFASTRERVAQQLRTTTGRRLFTLIAESNPHGWHQNTRNRLTNGDWADSVREHGQ